MTFPSSEEHGKEEGELSASDDEGQPILSDAIPTSRNTPTGHVVSVPSANLSIQRSRTGNAGSSNRSADVTPMLMPLAGKKIERKQAAFPSSIHGKTLSVGANSNLVISFSNDDSSSESDMQGQVQTSKIQPKVTSVSGNGKPPVSSLVKPKGPRQIDKSINKGITKNVPSTRTFSNTAYYKVANPSSGNQELQSRNFISAVGRKVNVKEQRSDQIVGLNNDKLQGLRQQIALRESELKLKAAQSNKDAVGGARKSSVFPTDSKQLETKEPAKKRLKVSGSHSVRPVEDRRMPIFAPMASEKPYIEKSLPQGETKGKQGADASLGCKNPGRNKDQINPPAVSQCFVQENTSPSILQNSMREAELNHHRDMIYDQPNFPVYKNSRDQNSLTSSELGGAMSSDQLLTSFNGNHQPFLANSGLWNFLGNTGAPGHSRLDMLALTNMEESLEKELEEAQEYRRICEIEERNALKAYRKAQRSLIEANARCAELYRRREMCSAHFGSLVVNDPTLLWPSICRDRVRTGFSIPNDSNGNVDMGTKSNHTGHNPGDFIQQECNGDVGCVNGVTHALPYSHSGQNLVSEPCSDPDASTSERLTCTHKQAVNRPHSLSSDPNVSPDDAGSFPVDHESCQHNLERQQEENLEETRGGLYNESNKNMYVGGNQDSLLLEASLRSKLFARMGMRSDSRGESFYKRETLTDRVGESDAASEKTQTSDCSVPLAEKYQQNDFGGTTKLEGSVCKAPVKSMEQCPITENSPIVQSTRDLEPNGFSPGSDFLSMSVAYSGPLFQSAFNHLKISRPLVVSLEQEHLLQSMPNSLYCDEMQRTSLVETPIYEGKFGLYPCDMKVDPHLPLCMYELRGRCNNDECSWQHLKDFSSDNMHQNQHDNPGRQCGSTLHQKKQDAMTGFQIPDVLLSPTYLVCSDTMKIRSHGSVVARRDAQSWWKFFTISLASSSSIHRDIATDGNEGRIEILGNLRTQSSYFGSRNSLMNQLKQGSDATVEPLEMALLIFSQEVDKLEGTIQALSVLSRHLEADPTSETHWIVYLLIYHAFKRSDGKDDMFSYAVKHNKGSYALWLMYINSRKRLTDQWVAYDDALSAICHHAFASGIDRKHASACILDLFLQMINFLCISGNVAEAVQRICKLLAPAAVSNDPHFLMLSDILNCLSFSDKCVFWVSCVYLVIYRKLPDSIIQGLEMEKELLSIEWPSVDLVGDEKERALKLLERGVQSVKLCANNGTFESGTQERSAQLFAVNHALCLVALKELENCRALLKEYIIVYPACLELKLLAARTQPKDPHDMVFAGFEDLLRNQPKEVPGSQCIWNQYAEYAFQGGRYEFVTRLMVRWYNSEGNTFTSQNQTAGTSNVDEHGLLKSASSHPGVAADQLDVMFGFLNLSLHSLLQNDCTEARFAINQALKAATPEHFMHCLRDHAVFQLIDELQRRDEFPISLQLRLLNCYLDLACSFPVKDPLPWKFVSGIEKPKVRNLVSNLLTSVSSELSVVNVALEAWYGPPLLPEKLSKQKDLVDFVEAILDLVPSNYPLALSVCKQLRRECIDSDVSCASVLYWAASNLVNTILCAVPVPPDHIWAEAADILSSISNFNARAERFLKKAVSVYPFSVKLWKSYQSLSKSTGNTKAIVETAQERGIKLD